MPKLSREEMEEFLCERRHLARIATLHPDGSPGVVPVWFLYESGRVFVTPRARSGFYADLRRDPRAALAIDEEANLYRKVLIEGRAEFLYEPGEDDRWRDLYRRIALRYVDEESADHYLEATRDQPRGLVAFDLSKSRVTTWRMPKAGEPYTGIWAKRYYLEGTKMRRLAEQGAASGPLRIG
jgi:PPOX class probable F420-dependent enzyme